MLLLGTFFIETIFYLSCLIMHIVTWPRKLIIVFILVNKIIEFFKHHLWPVLIQNHPIIFLLAPLILHFRWYNHLMFFINLWMDPINILLCLKWVVYFVWIWEKVYVLFWFQVSIQWCLGFLRDEPGWLLYERTILYALNFRRIRR
jgi:hypothetical protein